MAVNDTVHDFGPVDHNEFATWEFIITNEGNGTLTLDTIYTSSAWYSVSDPSVTVPAQGSATVLVHFQPDITPGALLDTLVVTGDDLDRPEISVHLSGASVWPILGLSETDLSFGDVRVGVTQTMQLTLSNTGSDTLFVDSIYVADTLSGFSVAIGEMASSQSFVNRLKASSGSKSRSSKNKKTGKKDYQPRYDLKSQTKTPALFAEVAIKTKTRPAPKLVSPQKQTQFSAISSKALEIATEIMPGESVGLDVSFMRDDTLTVVDELRITSDDPLGNNVVSIGLSGRSIAPVLVLAADTLDFGHILSESQRSVMVSNDGTDTLHVSGISFPTGFTGFMADSTLAPGEGEELMVSFAPTDNGYWTGDVLLTSDSYLQSEHSVALSAWSLVAIDTVHNFGPVDHNALASWELIVSNPSNGILTLDTIYTSSSWYSVSETSVTVPAQDSVTVLVHFQPDLTPGVLLDTLVITGDDLGNPVLYIPLSGESAWPVLELSETAITFDDVGVGTVKTMELTLSNTGTDTLFVDSIYVSDSLSGFSVALGEMNTSSSLIERIAISKSRSRVTPSNRSGSKGRKSGRSSLSSKDKSSSQPRSLNNKTDPKKASIPVKPGSFSLGKSPVRIGKQFNQLTPNSVLTIFSEVMPGESIGLDVSFMRDDTLTVVDELRITSDDPLGNNVVSIGLSGRSIAPVLVLAADTLDFGHILSESQRSVMVSNDGTDTLHVSGISFPTGFTGFMADSTLAPGEGEELMVSFAPTDNGYWTGDVLLTSDSYLQSEHSVALSALSINMVLVHDFGGVLTGLSADTTFTLNNTGNTDLVLDSVRIDQAVFTTDLSNGVTLSAAGSQSITAVFSPIERETADGNVMFYTPAHAAPIDFGTLSGDGWSWTEAEFATKSLSAVTSRGEDISFNITLTNSGDYALDYTVNVDADFAGFIWLTTAAGGQVSGTTTIDIPVNVEQTANLDPGTYNGFISFSTNTGTDPAVILPGTDTVDVFLNILVDNTQLADTTVTVESGNTDPIVFMDKNGEPMGIVVDFANSNGGLLTVRSIAAQPPVDENTPWVDPDEQITNPVFPDKYFEITTDIEGAFVTDIGFDYTNFPGVDDPHALRLARRPGNAGLDEPWMVIALDSTEINTAAGLVVAHNQTSFSQWAMISNESDNSFTDTQGPVIGTISLSPVDPATGVDLDVSVNIIDDSDIAQTTLFYAVPGPGNWSYNSVSMTASGNTYSGTIPAANVTYNGLVYYVQSEDALALATLSDTATVEVIFSGTAITTAMSGSQHPNGITMDAWRMISLPAVPDDKTITTNLVDELGTQDDNTWKMFRLFNGSYVANPTTLNSGEAYWIYQRVAENLVLNMSAGKSGDLDGVSVSIPAYSWTFMSAPYPFAININLDQETFHGPITYGPIGEGWTDEVTTLQPWGGYALYNRTGAEQTVLIDPAQGSGGLARMTLDDETGWQVAIEAQSGDYFDRYNRFGCLESASNELDWHDNPEITAPVSYLSWSFKVVHHDKAFQMTSDLRSLKDDVQIWDGEVHSSGMTEPTGLSWFVEQALPGNISVILVDLSARTQVDMIQESQYSLGLLDERYVRQVKIVSGSPEAVALTIADILSLIPAELSLDGNYPNPFNPVTTIRFGLPQPRKVRITVINLLGQEIIELVNGWQDIGRHEVQWQGQDHHGRPVSSGMYFTVLSDGHKTIVQKMLLLK
jgi:hypothetical protein